MMGEDGGKKERRRSEEGCGRVRRLRSYRERARRDTRRVSRATYPFSRSLIRCSTSSYAVERHLGSQGGGRRGTTEGPNHRRSGAVARNQSAVFFFTSTVASLLSLGQKRCQTMRCARRNVFPSRSPRARREMSSRTLRGKHARAVRLDCDELCERSNLPTFYVAPTRHGSKNPWILHQKHVRCAKGILIIPLCKK